MPFPLNSKVVLRIKNMFLKRKYETETNANEEKKSFYGRIGMIMKAWNFFE